MNVESFKHTTLTYSIGTYTHTLIHTQRITHFKDINITFCMNVKSFKHTTLTYSIGTYTHKE